MKNFTIFLITLFVFTGNTKAQPLEEMTYGTRYADEIVSLIRYSDSTSVVFMNKYLWGDKFASDSFAITVFKIDKEGIPVWAKSTNNYNLKVGSALQTADGNIVFTGDIYGYTHGIQIARMDTSGNINWQRIYNPGLYTTRVSKVVELHDSSLLVASIGYDTIGMTERVIMIKLDKEGNEITSLSYSQGLEYIYSLDLRLCSDSTISIICGNFSDSPGKMAVANFDFEGEHQKNKVFANDTVYKWGSAMDIDAENNTYITGNYKDGILCLKLNGDFDIEWAKSFSNPGFSLPAGVDIHCLNDSVIVIAGNKSMAYHIYGPFHDDIISIGINPDGELLWTKSIGGSGPDYAVSINAVSDTSFYIVGSTYSLNTEGQYDGYMVHFMPGSESCNTSDIDIGVNDAFLSATDSIGFGVNPEAIDLNIVWKADTIGYHNACECVDPKAIFEWRKAEITNELYTQNYSTWADEYSWTIDGASPVYTYELDDLEQNVNVCLRVENDCGSDEVCKIVDPVSVNEINMISLRAFPVPSSDIVQISFEMPDQYPDIRIIDMSGKQINSYPQYRQNLLTITKAETGPGLFVVMFTIDSQIVALKKIVFE